MPEACIRVPGCARLLLPADADRGRQWWHRHGRPCGAPRPCPWSFPVLAFADVWELPLFVFLPSKTKAKESEQERRSCHWGTVKIASGSILLFSLVLSQLASTGETVKVKSSLLQYIPILTSLPISLKMAEQKAASLPCGPTRSCGEEGSCRRDFSRVFQCVFISQWKGQEEDLTQTGKPPYPSVPHKHSSL